MPSAESAQPCLTHWRCASRIGSRSLTRAIVGRWAGQAATISSTAAGTAAGAPASGRAGRSTAYVAAAATGTRLSAATSRSDGRAPTDRASAGATQAADQAGADHDGVHQAQRTRPVAVRHRVLEGPGHRALDHHAGGAGQGEQGERHPRDRGGRDHHQRGRQREQPARAGWRPPVGTAAGRRARRTRGTRWPSRTRRRPGAQASRLSGSSAMPVDGDHQVEQPGEAERGERGTAAAAPRAASRPPRPARGRPVPGSGRPPPGPTPRSPGRRRRPGSRAG